MYRPYKGRSPIKGRVILGICIFLIVVAIAVFYLIIQENLVFTSDGMRLDLPFLNKNETENVQDENINVEELPINIQTQENIGEDTKNSGQSEETSPAKQIENPLFAAVLDVKKLSDAGYIESFSELYKAGAINCVVIDVKTSDGKLYFQPEDEVIKSSGAAADTSGALSNAIQKLSGDGLYVIARVCAFKDGQAPRTIRTAAAKTKSGVTWLDREMISWFNPYSPDTSGYFAALIREIQKLGFDEIMLTNLKFPTEGKVELIYYGEEEADGRINAVTDVLKAMKEEAEKTGVFLSVFIEQETAQSGKWERAGQSADKISELCDRILVPVNVNDIANADILDIYPQLSPMTEKTPITPVIKNVPPGGSVQRGSFGFVIEKSRYSAADFGQTG